MTVAQLWQNIELILREAGISSRRASLLAGLHPDALRAIKNGKMPSADRLLKIADALKTTPSELLGSDAPTVAAISSQDVPISEVSLKLRNTVMHQVYGATVQSGRSFDQEVEHRLLKSFEEFSVPHETLAFTAEMLLNLRYITSDEAKEMVQAKTSEPVLLESILILIKEVEIYFTGLTKEKQIAVISRRHQQTEEREKRRSKLIEP